MLFDVTKLKEQPVACTAGGGITDNGEQLTSTTKNLNDVMHLVDHDKTVHWVTEGDWSMHQLLQAVLQKIGPADVWISSYAFSELPARILAELKSNRTIGGLRCVIDSRIDVRSAGALQLLKNSCCELKMCHTHAKVTVLRNKEWFVCIAGSANYTTNKRYEAGMISTDAGVANFHLKWIENELAKL